jgi:hypothetical protein
LLQMTGSVRKLTVLREHSPENPYFNHVLERAWPLMFNCTNAAIADVCGWWDGADARCYC